MWLSFGFPPQHHCRNCGEIFCNSCSDNELPLPASPKPVRVCDTCHALLLQRCSSNPTWSSAHAAGRLQTMRVPTQWPAVRSISLLISTVFTAKSGPVHEHLVQVICLNLQFEKIFHRQNEGYHCETSLMSLHDALWSDTVSNRPTETMARISA